MNQRSNNGHEQNPLSAFLRHTKCPNAVTDHFRCVDGGGPQGFFKLGNLRLYGNAAGTKVSASAAGELPSVDADVKRQGDGFSLPFNPTELIENLRFEKYAAAANGQISYISNNQSLSRKLYYAIRPILPVSLRKYLQRIALQDWAKIPFPSWPIDSTVEDFVDWLWLRILESSGTKEIPFIWYWPKSYSSCAIMTHDVETGVGQEFCKTMLEIEAEFGIKSAFELVPEVRYTVSDDVLQAIRNAGSEVCVHGLNHDGRLFSAEDLFRTRAKAINQYATKWGAKGFRSPVMYRNLNWYDGFEFSYDMSVPNVAHLDPQRGGCCTLFPYFVGDVLELPLTTIQDYPLFNVIRMDPMQMWSKQIEAIASRHGLVSFIVHPDYIIEAERQDIYRDLLRFLTRYEAEKNMWLALPRDVDTWWRERAEMELVQQNGKWEIRGKGSERASIARVRMENGQLRIVPPDQIGESVECASYS